ncbi:MAG: serine/threonine protein kinase/formylglycine-generating enzyme required for sulfatase activity [Planctomycetota bacterium]|jgi:serine/threonine protein kinase/formylglycine-generating enzyme required for sulfatase activity
MSQPLSAKDRERLEQLFDRAIELPSAERTAFAARECGANHALHDELSRLLDADEGEDVVLRSKPIAPLQPGTRIGPYKLLEKVGEGGMGEVYAAEQLEPVVRRVALKVIKLGMDSREIVARFEAARQALARMTHANVAQVYDGGTTDSGSPYFVMEYVGGEPITEFCDRRKLSTRQRIELFLGVCEGVQHAHQKGIIHRDLKPSNLLVLLQDDRPVPKVIDFGVARATSGRLGDQTLYTAVGQIVGTLDYMSPEQADPTGVEVDTRSDVYSLGVVLYELISGLLPFEHKLSATSPLSELQRVIREQAPPTPSTRLKRGTGTATTIAPRHATDERSLVRQLVGDLDWICLRALEKDPARRYASASELAADLRRHLDYQPVFAGRPGALYRARKFVRRNRVSVAAALLVTLGVFAGLIGWIEGIAAKRLAEAREIETIAAEQLAEAQRPYADAHRLRELARRADEDLWPAEPQNIDAMELWRTEATALAATFDDYAEDLRLMRERALDPTSAEKEHDRATHDSALDLRVSRFKLTRLEWEFANGETNEQAGDPEERIAKLEQQIVSTEAELDTRRTWTFETSEDQAKHDTLTELVEGLRALLDPATGLLSEDEQAASPGHGWSVPRRIAFAKDLKVWFAPGGKYAKAWSEARDAGLELTMITGLVPIPRLLPSNGQPIVWEFAHLMTGIPAERRLTEREDKDEEGNLVQADELVLTNKTGVVLTLITESLADVPFKIGQAEVKLSPYLLSKYEMTQGQWKRLTGENPSLYGPDGTWQTWWLDLGEQETLLHPVEQVSWNDCMEWLPRAGLLLPSEAQWERGARAGTTTNWSSGQTAQSLNGFANLSDEYSSNNGGEDHAPNNMTTFSDGATMHQSVDSYRANGWGLHNVHGNVAEWCRDARDRNFFEGPLEQDPVAPWAHGGVRIYRGGSYRSKPRALRSSTRSYYPPSVRGHALGVRPAFELPK